MFVLWLLFVILSSNRVCCGVGTLFFVLFFGTLFFVFTKLVMCVGCSGAYNWTCSSDCEHVESCSFFHPHYQKRWACFQCLGFKVFVRWDVSGAGLFVTPSNYRRMCACCCDRAQLQYDWWEILLNYLFKLRKMQMDVIMLV